MKNKLILVSLLGLLCACANVPAQSSNSSSSSSSQSTVEEPDNSVDVIILAGQSNAEGNTRWKRNGLVTLSNDEITKYSNGFDSVQITYEMMGYSTHNNRGVDDEIQFEDVKLGQAYDSDCFGPEIGIAEKIQEKELDKPVYLIKFCSGGTNLYNQWRSTSSGTEGDRYKKFIPYVDDAIQALLDQDLNPVIKAFCWMQGESDSNEELKTALYETYEDNLFNDLNSYFEEFTPEGGMNFIDAGISDALNENGALVWGNYQRINDAKQNNVAKDPEHRYYIDTIGAGLLTDINCVNGGDIYHYDAESMVELGHLFGDVLVNNEII